MSRLIFLLLLAGLLTVSKSQTALAHSPVKYSTAAHTVEINREGYADVTANLFCYNHCREPACPVGRLQLAGHCRPAEMVLTPNRFPIGAKAQIGFELLPRPEGRGYFSDTETERLCAEGPKVENHQLPAVGEKSSAKQNEEHLARLMRMKDLFPFKRRRVVAYAGMKYDAQGKPRIKEMISRLVNLGVNCYSYLIDSHSQAELDALPEFCDLASKVHMEVWVVLVPPTEEPGLPVGSGNEMRYPPYGLNYQKWAKAIGQVSRRHHNLTLLMIDDFLYNINYLTPDYVKEIYTVLKTANPDLLLGVTIYENQLGRREDIGPYLPYINAVEWGYQHKASLSHNYGISAASLPGNISDFGKIFPKALLIPCIYFTPHSSWSRKATPSYLEEAMMIAYRQAGVALVFRTPFRGTANYELVQKFCREHRFLHDR